MTVPDDEGALDSSLSPPPTTKSGPVWTTAVAQGEGEGVDSAYDQASGPALPAEEWQLRVQPSHGGRRQHQLLALLPQADKHPEGADQLHLKWSTYGSEH